jgi:hypothetical protein
MRIRSVPAHCFWDPALLPDAPCPMVQPCFRQHLLYIKWLAVPVVEQIDLDQQ